MTTIEIAARRGLSHTAAWASALGPAIAMAPKAAVVATLYSAIPAVIVAYGYYWLIE